MAIGAILRLNMTDVKVLKEGITKSFPSSTRTRGQHVDSSDILIHISSAYVCVYMGIRFQSIYVLPVIIQFNCVVCRSLPFVQ